MAGGERLTQRMRAQDIKAFQRVAMIQRLWILVRQTNEASLQWFGRPGFMAKPIDCKPKTADRDVTLSLPDANGKPVVRTLKTAGLVVNPTLPGFDAAFAKAGKPAKARAAWEKFISHRSVASCLPREGKEVRTWPGPHAGWAVQMCPMSEHYGCLLYSTYPAGMNGSYVHGDYDVFGIVPADDPTDVRRVRETLSDESHARGPNTQSVQFAVNAMVGMPVIKHGEQELFADFDDEALDVFCPDGNFIELPDAAAARHFYLTTLRGRHLFRDLDPANEFAALGRWKRSTG